MNQRQLILDANILIRAILGNTSDILERYGSACTFMTSEHSAGEARQHLASLLKKKGLDVQTGLEALEALFGIVRIIPSYAYEDYKESALKRIAHRDANDWPSVALSLLIECPIWTEDGDFFGVGIATWQTRNIEIYLQG